MTHCPQQRKNANLDHFLSYIYLDVSGITLAESVPFSEIF